MDPQFKLVQQALRQGELRQLRAELERDPSLGSARSGTGHPTLLQFLATEGKGFPCLREAVCVLVAAGGDATEALVGAASVNHLDAAEALLDAGAAVDGDGKWSPLEEALYWGHGAMAELLLARGAAVSHLRTAAGLGRLEVIRSFFDAAGVLKPEAGGLAWPFGDGTGHAGSVGAWLQQNRAQWDTSSQGVVNHALLYACINGRMDAVRLLLELGAEVNAVAPGFDYAGTPLHYAAFQGNRELADYLLAQGADPTVRDPKVGQTPAGWAAHRGHYDLADRLRSLPTAAGTPG